MRLIAFQNDGVAALGVRQGDEVIDLGGSGVPTTLEALLRGGPVAMEAAQAAAKTSRRRLPIDGLKFLPPISSPAKAIAVGLNYVDHAAETKLVAPTYPILFHRFPTSWVAHRQALVKPDASEQFDFEGELVVVIGLGGRAISKQNALDHVAGYSVFNEGSVRDFQFKSHQWMIGKNFDKSGSFGPQFVTADELPAGAKGLAITTRLNGQTVQDANTDNMIFDVATLVSTCSIPFALQPGDMIIAGTPAGVGMARKPPLWMKPGDTCEVEIEGVGLLSNPVEAEKPAG